MGKSTGLLTIAMLLLPAALAAQTRYYVRERLVGVAPRATPTPTPTPTAKAVAVVNGGFESGALTPWSPSGTVTLSATANSGSYSAQFASNAQLSQTLSTDARSYRVTFACYATAGYSIAMYWNSSKIGECGTGGNNSWQTKSFTVVGTGGSDVLMFDAPNASSKRVDDVSIAPA